MVQIYWNTVETFGMMIILMGTCYNQNLALAIHLLYSLAHIMNSYMYQKLIFISAIQVHIYILIFTYIINYIIIYQSK